MSIASGRASEYNEAMLAPASSDLPGRAPSRRGGALLAVVCLAFAACDAKSRLQAAVQGHPRSVRALLLAVDDALRHGSADVLEALIIDAASIRELCPGLDPSVLEELERYRAKMPPSACVGLTDWSKLERTVLRFPFTKGLNIETKVCDEAWEGCAAITRMCKSEIFYVVPETPDAGFKVNVNWVVRVGEEHWLSRAPRCMAKGTNAMR